MKLELTNNELTILLEEINKALPKINKEGGQPLKLHLTTLFQKVSDVLIPFNNVKNEFIKDKGVLKDDGTYILRRLKDETEHDVDSNITDEFKEFITFKMIPISYFEKLISDDVFPILSKFVEL
jgi:hypothetical protein